MSVSLSPSRSISPFRPFAALTALALVATGLALAPVATAGAASASSSASSIVSKLNSSRSNAKLAKLKTANDLNELAAEYAAGLAKAKSTNIQDIDGDAITVQIGPFEDWVYLAYKVTGGKSAVISSVTKKITAGSSKADKTFLYGDYNYTGLALKKSGSTTYAFVMFADLTMKLQDSTVPKIVGTAKVGKTLKVDMNGWKVGDGDRDYSWVSDGATVGDYATPLVITPELVGKRIWVAVYVSRNGYYSVARYSGETAQVAKGTIASRPTPKVTGSRVVGSVLTATAGTWTTGAELAYQWKSNGVAIADATSTTYTQVAADRGHRITVSITGTRPGYNSSTKTSASPSATLGIFTAPIPTISSPNENVGVTFTAGVGAWTPKASSYSYRWYRDGVPISKATRKTYTTVTKDRDTEITVRVTGEKSGYRSLSITSNPHFFGVQ